MRSRLPTSQRFRVPESVLGVDFKDGRRKYDADRRHIVEVPRGDFNAVKYATEGMCEPVLGLALAGSKARERDCEGCGLTLWAWQERCPRCDA